MSGYQVAAARQGLAGRQHHAFPQTLGGLQQRLQTGGTEAVVVGEEKFHEQKVRKAAGALSWRLQGTDLSPVPETPSGTTGKSSCGSRKRELTDGRDMHLQKAMEDLPADSLSRLNDLTHFAPRC